MLLYYLFPCVHLPVSIDVNIFRVRANAIYDAQLLKMIPNQKVTTI